VIQPRLQQEDSKGYSVPATHKHDEVHRAPLPVEGGSVSHFDTRVEGKMGGKADLDHEMPLGTLRLLSCRPTATDQMAG